MLFGDGFWAAEPSAAAIATIGALPRLEELQAAAAAAGFRIERDEVSDLAEWDAFEAGWRSGLEVSTDPEAVAFAAERRREYEEGYRDAIGFAWLVLAPRVRGWAHSTGSTGNLAATTFRPSRS